MAALLERENPEDAIDLLEETRGGFNFENCGRNLVLTQKLLGKTQFPRAKKTGTTICGIQLNNAVCLAADTRATAGSMVADKNADKLHFIAPNIFCAGAGTSADLTATTDLMSRDMEIHRLNTGTQTRVCTVVNRLSKKLFQYQGHIGCALVLGGVDVTGPHLYQIYPHGSTDKLPYTTMGSGSLAAMSVLEMGYKEDMTVEQGKELVADAIHAGIFNDLGSGGNIDVCVIEKGKKPVHERAYRQPIKRAYKADFQPFAKGTTPLLSEAFRAHAVVHETKDRDGDVAMGMNYAEQRFASGK